jgi:DNA-binding NarL/FixJ family response regulator
VLVADDQTVVREGLVMLLGLSPGIEVVAAAVDGDEATRLARQRRPDVVLMDLRMPRCDGVVATRRILAESPTTRVIVLTTYADDESVFAALEAGARGYLTKDANASEIQRAIQTVFSGEALLDPSVQRRLLERSLAGGSAPPAVSYPDGLTQREVEVLREIARGHTNREIAERLTISEATVKTHVNNIFSKAGLRDRAQAVVYAIRSGLAD